jgi:hypothetical protein
MERFEIKGKKFDEILDIVRRDGYSRSDERAMAILDGDWPNAQEHQKWLNTATAQEIADWVTALMSNEAEDED